MNPSGSGHLENNPVYFSTNRISNDDPGIDGRLPYIVRGFDVRSTGDEAIRDLRR
jgi:hypothetical protein